MPPHFPRMRRAPPPSVCGRESFFFSRIRDLTPSAFFSSCIRVRKKCPDCRCGGRGGAGQQGRVPHRGTVAMPDVIGRVLRRRAFAHFSVLELAATSVGGERLAAPLAVCAILKAEAARWADGAGAEAVPVPADVFAFVKGSVRLGDVVQLAGVFDVADTRHDRDAGGPRDPLGAAADACSPEAGAGTAPRACQFRVSAVALLEKWDRDAHGDLYYAKGAPPEGAQVDRSCGRMPQLIVQCHSSFVERLVAYVHATGCLFARSRAPRPCRRLYLRTRTRCARAFTAPACSSVPPPPCPER
jgi:hypothetical protein